VTIRPIEVSDLPAITDLVGMLKLPDRALADWSGVSERGVVATDEEGEIAGGSWFVSGTTPELFIGVRPDCQGRGVGKRVLAANVAQAVALGLWALAVVVKRDNDPVLRLLEGYNTRRQDETPEGLVIVLVLNDELRLGPGSRNV